MARTVISEKWELLPIEKKKLLTSLGWGMLSFLALGVVAYLEQFGLPEQLKFLAPFVPVLVNFLNKWAGEHKYTL